jgi:fatty-acyl-CoA synthase
LELLPGRTFAPDAFAAFLSAQDDLGTKWVPSFVRVSRSLPQTASGKVTKGRLRAEGWWASDEPVFRLSGPRRSYLPMDDRDHEELYGELRRHGRLGLVGG